MNFNAIYKLRENGEDSYYYSERGGDYQTALEAMPCLQNMRAQRVSAWLTMERLVYHPEDPDSIVLFDCDEENGPFVFLRTPSEQAEKLCMLNGEPVSGMVTLDFDAGCIRYAPNDRVPVANGMFPSELTIRAEAGLACFEKAKLDAMQPLTGRYVDILNHLLSVRLPALAAEWEQLRGRTALFTVRELEQDCYLRTKCGGGLANVFVLLHKMEDAVSTLEDLSIPMETTALLHAITPSTGFVGIPTSRYGRPMFQEVEPDAFQALLATMDSQEDIAEHVMLDFDERTLSIQRGAWTAPGGRTTISLSFDDALEWLEWAKREARDYPPKEYLETVERLLTEKLPGSIEAPTSEPGLNLS